MNPGVQPTLHSRRLLDQLRERIRYCHYSLKTEKAYVFWAKRYIRFHGLRHPRDMGKAEVESFLTDLATSRKCAPSTHKQALAALLFLYREVLGVDLPWMTELGRPRGSVRIPVVLSRIEMAELLSCTDSAHLVVVSLLYGAGLRLMECLGLRIKDVDFDRKVIVVRGAKNRKDRVVMLPKPAIAGLKRQLAYAYSLWSADRANGVPDVYLPDGAAIKFPRAGASWPWVWVFPSPGLSMDPRARILRRYHQYEQTVGRAIARAVAKAHIPKKVSA